MSEQMPTLDPSGSQMTASVTDSPVPTGTPPVGAELTNTEGMRAPEAGADLDGSAPALPLELEAATGIGASVWHNNKRIVALWSINQNRNAWVGIDGIGWKRLSNVSDQGVVALNMLGAHAREKGSSVNLREDGALIREIYVW